MTDTSAADIVLAAGVADGSIRDWSELERAAVDDDARDLVRQFAALARITARPDALDVGHVWGALTLIQEIGQGSFGTVYLARDGNLQRDVALKLFRTLAFTATGLDAAIHEGRLLARVTHPNVVVVHGADQHGGRFGIWTEFVDGRTLKEVVAQSGPLSAEETVTIAARLCQALAAVHKAGLVHGDVKAQNVMRQDGGRIVLMDFGAGAAITASAQSTDLVGTPAYLAPELLEGHAPTVASDIYALGVLMFYLVTGDFPFDAASLDELRAAHRGRRYRRLLDLRPDLPSWLGRLIDLATNPDPHQRPASAGAFEESIAVAASVARPPRSRRAVRTVAVLVPAAIVVLAVAAMPWLRSLGGERQRSALTIADFATPGADRATTDLATAARLELVTHMRAVSALRVLADNEVDARALKLEATARRDADGLVIEARVTDPDTRRELWHDAFAQGRQPVSTFAQTAGRAIAVAMKARFSPEWDRVLQSAGGNTEAAALYVTGLSHLNTRQRADMMQARTLFEKAIAAAPSFALAEGALAESVTVLGVVGEISLADALPLAEGHASRAVALDSHLPEGHAILGYVKKLQLDFAAAERSLATAVALRPDFADARIRLSTVHTQQNRCDLALSEIKGAVALEPRSMQSRGQFIVTLYYCRRYDEAVREARDFLVASPDDVGINETLGLSLMETGDFEGARVALGHAVASRPNGGYYSQLAGDIAVLDARAGRRAAAIRQLQTFETKYTEGGEGAPPPSDIAAIHEALGNPVAALRWLKAAAEQNDARIGYLLVEPRWDSLRRMPAFAEISSRIRQ